MRRISGKYKNRELKSPNSSKTHPLSERARLSIFNMLVPVENKTVLDLFAGTGALGLEALSRGAKSCTFVENHPKTLQTLKQNLQNIENATVLKTDAYQYAPKEKFDLIFLDPPYDQFDLKILDFKKHLNDNGTMIISSPKPLDATSRHYANCFITLVKK